MHHKPEGIFQVLAEGGSISISRVTVNGQYRYLNDHHEMDLTDEGLGINRQIGYGSFEEAFLYISKYPWHLLFLYTVHPDYRMQVLDLLMEKLNQEPKGEKYYKEKKLSEHEKVLGAKIYKDPLGTWNYSLDDFGHSKFEMFYKK